MDKPSFRARYHQGQLLLTLGFGEDALIVVRRWLSGTDTWTLLADDVLHNDYAYPRNAIREWVENNTDPLTAEITLNAFEDRVLQAVEVVDGLREEHVPAHRVASEFEAMPSFVNQTALF